MFENLPDQLYKALIKDDRWLLYLEGLGNTILIAVGAVIIGLFLGALVAMVKVHVAGVRRPRWYHKLFNAICDVYLTVIRGTPMMTQLLIMVNVIFWSADVSMSIYISMLAFGVNSGAYVAEIIRAGINAVSRGQTEAGRSLGLPGGKTMRLIVLPQAVKNILPALGNELIVLVKETAIVGYVAVQDLTKMADWIRTKTFQPLVPLLLSALIYLCLVMLMTWGLRKLERRLARSDYR